MLDRKGAGGRRAAGPGDAERRAELAGFRNRDPGDNQERRGRSRTGGNPLRRDRVGGAGKTMLLRSMIEMQMGGEAGGRQKKQHRR